MNTKTIALILFVTALTTGCEPGPDYYAEHAWTVRVQKSWSVYSSWDCASYKEEVDRITLLNTKGVVLAIIYKGQDSVITIERATQPF
jgi:hypothetical protein